MSSQLRWALKAQQDGVAGDDIGLDDSESSNPSSDDIAPQLLQGHGDSASDDDIDPWEIEVQNVLKNLFGFIKTFSCVVQYYRGV